MDTLHKKLSEIRDLRAEELDLVGGASEGTSQPSYADMHYGTQSYQYDGMGNYRQVQDDTTTQSVQVDW